MESEPALWHETFSLRGVLWFAGPLDAPAVAWVGWTVFRSPPNGEPLIPVRDPSSAAGGTITGVISCSLPEADALSEVWPRWLSRGGAVVPTLGLGRSGFFDNRDEGSGFGAGVCSSGLPLAPTRGGCMLRRNSSNVGPVVLVLHLSSLFSTRATCTICFFRYRIFENWDMKWTWILNLMQTRRVKTYT